jgi:hypothetical protein
MVVGEHDYTRERIDTDSDMCGNQVLSLIYVLCAVWVSFMIFIINEVFLVNVFGLGEIE